MEKQNAILIIDAQYDFCNPEGALYVDGATEDMNRLAAWIIANKTMIDHIVVTADSHPVNDISHPSYWVDKEGNFPPPFTPISAKDIHNGTWAPRFNREETIQYVETLERQGEFGHFIWPYHCITGSKGAALDDTIMNALVEWTREGKFYELVEKGTNPHTEHFGIFRANVTNNNYPETLLNQKLINKLNEYENIYIAGEAKSHCVANSLKQIMEAAPALAKKFIVLEDCMSDVTGLEHLGVPIFEKARKMGIRFTQSTEVLP